MHRYDWEAQKELAQQIIAPAAGALHNQGVHVEVHLYAGRLAKAIKNYSVDKDIHWIVTQFLRPGLIGYLSAKTLALQAGLGICFRVRVDPRLTEDSGSKDILSKGLAHWANSGRRCFTGFLVPRPKEFQWC